MICVSILSVSLSTLLYCVKGLVWLIASVWLRETEPVAAPGADRCVLANRSEGKFRSEVVWWQ